MGKIVRGAHFADEAYVVAVPDAPAPDAPDGAELDEQFATSADPFEHAAADPLFDSTAPAPPREPAIDWNEVRFSARTIVEDAATASEAMLNDAARRASELLEQAHASVAALESDARAKGHEEGTNAGRVAIETQLADGVANLHAVVEEARAQRRQIFESAEPELVKLAMAIAERIVHEQISVDPNVVLENVRQSLTRLIGREVVTLRVNPADLDIIRQHREAIVASNDVEHLRIVEDQRVDRGGVVVETDAGTIDAKISTQIQEARRTLLPELSGAQAS
jgi:flagellar assembly protein FliH